MNETTQHHPRRIPVFLTSGLLLATLAAGLLLNGQATPVAGYVTSASAGPLSLSVRADRTAVLTGEDGRVRMELVLTAKDLPARSVSVPTDLLVVLDRSGSMQGDKLKHGLAAIDALIAQLGEQDRFALVTYSYDAELAIPLASASQGAKRRSRAVLESIVADGGTNMSRGLDVAYETLHASRDQARATRVILISDGLANHGDATEEGLTRRASRFTEQEQVLSAVGVGLDFNEYVMSRLADAGTGNYYYLEHSKELAQIFAKEFSATKDTVARGVFVKLELGDGVDVVDVAGYPLEREHGTVGFRPGSLFAGQERRVWVTYQIPTDRAAEYDLGRVSASYSADGERHLVAVHDSATIACVQNEEAYVSSVDKEVWEQSVVNEAYGQLRQSVARAVKEGREDDAKATIEAYRTQQEWMNERLESDVVDQNLVDVKKLEADLDDAFDGSNQADKQNRFSKTNQSEALSSRRSGSKK